METFLLIVILMILLTSPEFFWTLLRLVLGFCLCLASVVILAVVLYVTQA